MAKIDFSIVPALPGNPHLISGTRLVDAAVSSVEVLMHRFVSLKEWSLRGAANAYWRLYWPISRGGLMTFQGVDHALEPGWLYLISPHTAFDSRCTRVFSKWYLHFTLGGLPTASRQNIAQFRPSKKMQTLLTRVCPDQRRSHARPQLGVSLEALELILLAVQKTLPEFQHPAHDQDRLAECMAYLEQHHQKKITLEDLARFAGVSERRLSQLFVSGLGFPPMRYLIELRLNHAMKLLRHSSQDIEAIATECGFPNRYYFTRMLSKYRKTTPAAFRSQVRFG